MIFGIGLVLMILYWIQSKCFSDEIEDLPDVLVDKVTWIPELLKDARADSTTKCYNRGFIRWRKWALSNSLGEKDIFPAKPFIFGIYLCSIVQSSNSFSAVSKSYYSVKWMHDLYGLTSPTDSSLVKNILEAAKRKLSKKIVKKEPVTPVMLLRMFNSLYQENNIKNQRIICACLLAYAGFLRSEELLKIRRSDIVFHSTYINIFIESSKTDVYRDGNWVTISCTGTMLCPVVNLQRYLTWANIDCDSDIYIFCGMSKCKNGYKLRDMNKPISYTTLRELFIEAFKYHVPDISKFGLHSLRSGDATAAANNGIKDRLFKRHGRWRSENAKDGYIKDCLSERLSVSQNLGL
ncbi:uncharacterized protein LOC123561533 isoform X1 [Mercenaria mercenaria]|uniref:uncharacterized protein LOC123561533 isoform X1 n=1 Tax=Mercenaria mercenaria TaxID=6596 RepID=UPI00234F0C84|nr:uncharacterized protein LOC123561533 isoform X1 [Mercenaria mercenaria]